MLATTSTESCYGSLESATRHATTRSWLSPRRAPGRQPVRWRWQTGPTSQCQPSQPSPITVMIEAADYLSGETPTATATLVHLNHRASR